MRSDASAAVLNDMLHHLALAEHFLGDLSLKQFAEDVRTVYAVTRCLEIISEASRRLPDEVRERHPHIAWRQMAAAGNVYRHQYEDVAARYVWNTVKQSLPSLRAVVETELRASAGT